MGGNRADRRHETRSAVVPGGADSRTPFEKDRDRIIYTSAFRRLAGVTQVVGPFEGHIFHNRLTHTLEVAQIARRLADRLRREYSYIPAVAGIDPDVVEAAALAHDLGHPPFGHVAETALNEAADSAGGFEGNAQSFRIVTRLAAHKPHVDGLNLTRATLNAILKYPWLRGESLPGKEKKYGAFQTEHDDFVFAREGEPAKVKSLEAEIMDHADAVAYSVHDVDDFHRAGLIPLEIIQDDFKEHVDDFKKHGRGVTPAEVDDHAEELRNLITSLPTLQRYSGTRRDRSVLRSLTARLIGEFVMHVKITVDPSGRPTLEIPADRNVQMRFLQRLLWRYVIDSPRLATQQFGQRTVVNGLFKVYKTAITEGRRALIPAPFLEQFDQIGSGSAGDGSTPEMSITRMAVDIVASLTDHQATRLYRRLCGIEPGSVTELLEG